MATEHIIRVTFGEGGGNQTQNNLDPKVSLKDKFLDVLSNNKAGITALFVANKTTKSIANYISVSSQISGASMYMNKLMAPKRAVGAVGRLVSDPIGMTLEIEQWRSEIDKEEKKQNNIRAIVGLEATNFSRYSGQRR